MPPIDKSVSASPVTGGVMPVTTARGAGPAAPRDITIAADKLALDVKPLDGKPQALADPLLTYGPPAPVATPRRKKPVEPMTKVRGPVSVQVAAGADAFHELTRIPYTGGAPTLHASQMDPNVIKSNVLLRFLYGLKETNPVRGFGLNTLKFLGPIGATANLVLTFMNTKRAWADPNTPTSVKVAMGGATGLAAASAGTALYMVPSALGYGSIVAEKLAMLGRFSGATGLGAGAILSAVDTYLTFKNPNSTAAERGFSTLATASSMGVTALVLAGACTGPIGIALVAGAIGFSLAKGLLGKSAWANKAFGAVGSAISTGVSAVTSAASAVTSAASAVGGAISRGLAKLKFW